LARSFSGVASLRIITVTATSALPRQTYACIPPPTARVILVWEVPVMKGLTRLAIIVLTVVLVTGCATWPASPVYSQDELKARCERTGGWWRPNILDGYCEYELARQMP